MRFAAAIDNFCVAVSDKYHLGTPIPNPSSEKGEICSFTINASKKKEGEIMTPTYPGTYPKNMECSYKFIGKYNQIPIFVNPFDCD